jgi:hypothetical protein
MLAPPICRRSRRNASRAELVLRDTRFVGSDEDGGSRSELRDEQRAIRHSEHSERSN